MLTPELEKKRAALDAKFDAMIRECDAALANLRAMQEVR